MCIYKVVVGSYLFCLFMASSSERLVGLGWVLLFVNCHGFISTKQYSSQFNRLFETKKT